MNKKLLLFLSIVLYGCFCQSQEVEKNEIFYIEVLRGYIGIDKINSDEAKAIGGSLNWEFNKNLLSFRYNNLDFEKTGGRGEISLSNQPVVIEHTEITINELSFLYGRRFIMNNWSISGSSGVSYSFEAMDYYKKVTNSTNNYTTTNSSSQSYFGIPYELNVMLRTPKKRLVEGKGSYWSFNLSFKIFGNISKHNYTGLGIGLGLGRHR